MPIQAGPMVQRLVVAAAIAAAVGSIPTNAVAQATADRGDARTLVAIRDPVVAFSPIAARRRGDDATTVRDPMLAMPVAVASRSRSRGARRGLVIGAVGGALLGLVITNDFMDEPVVNMAMSAAVFGVVGAGIGALVGAEVPSATPPSGQAAARR